MLNEIRKISTKYFNGDTRRGPRQLYLMEQLRKRRCKPYLDRYGNIWVEKGSGNKLVLFSSHMDVDPRIRDMTFRSYVSESRRIVSGILDNAIGCYINLILAQEGPRRGRAIYVFTASEEVDRKTHARFARSAYEVIGELGKKEIKPDLCVAIDVTYPRLLHHHKRINWNKKHHEIFDINDATHCYVDGYSTRKSKQLAADAVKRFRNSDVETREFFGHDEAHVYKKLSPSFACGPVVYGSFDKPYQNMPVVHAKTTLSFLRSIA